MLLKLQIIILLLAGVQSMEKEQWARHVVLIFYTDQIPLKKGEAPPYEYFHETIPNCFGTLLTDNHILTGATCVTNYKKYDKSSLNFQLGDEEGIDNWRILKVLNPTIFKIMQCDNGSFDRSIA